MRNAIILIFGVALTSGCASSRLPPRLSAVDQKRITPLNVTVSVEPYEYQVYSDSLKTDLHNTKLFKAVDYRHNLSTPPDLVVNVEERIHGTAAIPCLAALTLGIVPCIVQEEWGQVFSFSPPDDPSKRVRVEFRYESATVLGWAGLFLNLSPGWSSDPHSSQRYLNGLALAISTNAATIDALMRDDKPSR